MKFITLMLGGFSPLCTIAMICNIITRPKKKLDNQENVNTQQESDKRTRK